MRIRKTSTTKEYESTIDDYITQGYHVKERGQDSARLFKRKASASGHVWVAILTVWWTAGLGNLAYHFLAPKDEVLVRMESGV